MTAVAEVFVETIGGNVTPDHVVQDCTFEHDRSGRWQNSAGILVLLVDDEPDMLFSLKGLLVAREFGVVHSRERPRGLANPGETPDPRRDGRSENAGNDRCRTLGPRGGSHSIRIRFASSLPAMPTCGRSSTALMSRACIASVTKPWDPDDLIELLHEAAARHDEMVERRQLLVDVRTYLESEAGSASRRLAAAPAARARSSANRIAASHREIRAPRGRKSIKHEACPCGKRTGLADGACRNRGVSLVCGRGRPRRSSRIRALCARRGANLSPYVWAFRLTNRSRS